MTGQREMTIHGLSCTLHMPAALKSRFGTDGEELDNGLPPGAPRKAFDVDLYDEACPQHWRRSKERSRSFFVAVKPEHGLWLDFNGCASHTHDVAVLVSMQGVNAITGMPVTRGDVSLEQYRDECPKHGERLVADRLCRSCGYKWPPQNYLATTGAPRGQFWLDGFRAEDGVVRQFVFTEEESRGVAAQIIGEERTFAISIAFFLSKQPKPPPPGPIFRDHVRGPEFFGGRFKGVQRYGAPSVRAMDVAAGARVKQHVHQDPKDLDYWEETPAGVLYVNYTDEATARMIIGAVDLPVPNRDGFLGDLQTGHVPDPFKA